MKLTVFLVLGLSLSVEGLTGFGWFPWFTRATTCKISIQKDLHDVPPLLLKPYKRQATYNANKAYYLPVNSYGDINFTSADTINLSCPDSTVLINGRTTGKSVLPIRCKSQKTFEIIATGESATLYSFSCKDPPAHEARATGKRCLKNLQEIEIGFQIDSGVFLRDLLVCFNQTEQSVAYSSYNLTQAIKGFQFDAPRPQFIEGDFYSVGNHKVESLYTRYVQRLNVNRQLGLSTQDTKYITNGDYFLSRGHLTAKADFVYAHQQNATFYFVNAAPQWQTFNEGNWNSLEQNVRNYGASRQKDLVIYTGTHGVASLPHESTGRQTPLYLFNENGRKGIPIPRIYWKVVYEPSTKAGIAFIGLNNPYQKAVSEDVLCQDICNQLQTWKLSWNRTNILLGYGYCCHVDDLRKKVTNVPSLNVQSTLV